MGQDHRRRSRVLPFAVVALLLVALAFLLYWQSLGNPLVLDSNGIRDRLLPAYLSSRLGPDVRWLANLSFGWTWEVFGREWEWHRAVNISLHAAVALALFLFLGRLFETVPGVTGPRGLALLGALFFLVHPVSVYAVAYLIQRSIVMATLFSLLALWLFLEGLVRRSAGWYTAAAIAYGLALLSKEHAVMLPAVAVALAVLVRGVTLPPVRRLAVPALLMALLAAAAVFRMRSVIGTAYEPLTAELTAHLHGAAASFERWQLYPLSILNQALLFFRYLLVWVLPMPQWMSVDLRPPFPTAFTWWPWGAALLAWIGYAVLACRLLLRRGNAGLLGFALLFPWLLALTEIATVRFQEPLVLYRSYLWMSGLPAALPVLAGRLPGAWRYAVPAFICLLLIVPQQDRLRTFSSPYSLWDDAIRKNRAESAPWVERPWVRRGLIHVRHGRYPEALRDLDRAHALNPRSPDVWLGRGTVMLRTGDLQQALANLDRAVTLDPEYAAAYEKRCVVRMLLDDRPGALSDCRAAVRLDPESVDAHVNLGVVLRESGNTEQALKRYRRALELDPENGSAHYNYGVLLLDTDRLAQARTHLSDACAAGITRACALIPQR